MLNLFQHLIPDINLDPDLRQDDRKGLPRRFKSPRNDSGVIPAEMGIHDLLNSLNGLGKWLDHLHL